jgi:hypothetical protein
VVALAVAIYAGPNQTVATGLGIVALVAIGLLLLVPARSAAVERRRSAARPAPEAALSFRAALESGRSGRSEVVAQLDMVERRSGRPERPTTTGVELQRLRELSRSEFRAYVNGRLDAIEAVLQ